MLWVRRTLPAWGAWIEIDVEVSSVETIIRRSPHGERGLKWNLPSRGRRRMQVAPHMGSVD